MKVSRSTYYDAINRGISKREKENEQLKIKILEIYNKSKKRYGTPKIQKMLEKEGYEISLKRVQRLMKKLGIKSIIIKKYRPSTSKSKVPEGKPNLIDQDFTTTRLNEKWVGDITYIYTIKDGWTYLASILDLHSKKIIGYSYSRNMTTEIVVEALKNAMKGRKIEEGLILHTDLGSQYTSKEFEEYLERCKIKHSYSKKGCPYDNACIESFHATLKKEEVNISKYIRYAETKLILFEYIEGWYNSQRIHSTIGYKTPNEVEREYLYSI